MPEYVSSAGALNQGLLQGVQTFGNLGINLSNIAEDRRRYEETKGINAKAAATAHQQAKATFLVNLMDKVQGIASAGKGSPAENAKRAVAFYNEAVKSSGYPDIPPIDPAMFTDDNTAVLQQYGQAVKTGDMQVAMQLGMQLGHPQAETLAAVKYFKDDRDIQSEKEGLQSSANALVESKLPPVQFGKYDITQQPEPANLGLLNDRLDIPPMQERGSLLGNRNLTASIPYTLPRPLTPEQQAEKAVVAGGNKEVLQNYIKDRTKSNVDKEFNIPADLDGYLATKAALMGYDYSTREGRMNAIKIYGANPAMHKEFIEYKKSLAPPLFSFTPTAMGIGKGNMRSGELTDTGVNKPIPEAEITKGSDLGSTMKLLERIEPNIKNEYLGQWDARYSQQKQKWVDLPQGQSTFYADILDYNDKILRERSKSQTTEQEYDRLTKFLLDPTVSENTFRERFKRSKLGLQQYMEERAKQLSKGGFGTEKELNPQRRATDIQGETTLTMPDGSTQTFDASGKRIK